MKPALTCALCLLTAGPVAAAHVDILLWREAGAVRAGGFDFSTSQVLPQHTVFAEMLTVEPQWTRLATTGAPGGNALRNATLLPPGGQVLPPSAAVGFNLLGTLPSLPSLLYWDGTGPVSFGPVPSGEVLQYRLFSNALTIDAATPPQPGFRLGTTSGGSYLHLHADFNLYGGYPLSDSSTDHAAPGAYLLSMEATVAGLTPSNPVCVLLGHSISGEQLAAARAWTTATFAVPEPTPTLLLLIPAAALASRSRSLSANT